MKFQNKNFIVLCFALIIQTLKIDATNKVEYDWFPSNVGGGGYITGLIQDPLQPDIMYGRCDVAGVFKSIDRGKSWSPINNGTIEYFHHSVDGFAISTARPNVLFRCSGDARGNRMIGAIHKSKDAGNSWYKVCDEADFFGNGPNRMMGEKIAVDPFDPNFVATVSYHNGVFISTDEGEHFSYSGLKDEPGCVIAFHPYKKNVLYVGTRYQLPFKEYLYPATNYNRPKQSKLFVTKDKGKTWEICYQGNELEFLDMTFDMFNENIVFVASSNGIFKSTDGGEKFYSKN